jgi:hypothetical protein
MSLNDFVASVNKFFANIFGPIVLFLLYPFYPNLQSKPPISESVPSSVPSSDPASVPASSE